LSALLVLLSVPGLRSQIWRRIRRSSSRDPSAARDSSGSRDQAIVLPAEDAPLPVHEGVTPLLRVQPPRSGADAPVPRLMAGRLVPALVADQRVVHRAPDDLTDFVPLHPAMAPIPVQPTWLEPSPVGHPSKPIPAAPIPLPISAPATVPTSVPTAIGPRGDETEPDREIPARRPPFGWRIGWSLGRASGRAARLFRRPGRR
jgi:hypothetical protein